MPAGQAAGRRGAAFVAGLCVMGLFLGGGNLVTAFGTLLVSACVLCLLAVMKNRRWRALLLPFAFLLAGFLVNVCAPGNSVRQQSEGGEPLPAALAVLRAVQEAVLQLDKNLTLPILLALVFLLPVLWNAAAAARLTFRWPLLFFVLTFGLYAAQFCPTWYALKQAGPDRLLDIIFYSAFFWMAAQPVLFPRLAAKAAVGGRRCRAAGALHPRLCGCDGGSAGGELLCHAGHAELYQHPGMERAAHRAGAAVPRGI